MNSLRLVLRFAAPVLLAACGETGSPTVPRLIAWIEAGPVHTCALTDSARAFCWGGVATALQGSDSLSTATPVPVRGDLRWQSIGVGDGFACGLTGAGEARCWALSASASMPHGRVGDPVPARVLD